MHISDGGRVSTVRLASASSIGTTLEWYDFTVYNTLAALVFNQLFFPSVDPMSGTILAFSTYAVGYLSRPLGGVIFGHLGDRLGRRFVLVATLVLMGLTTGLMGMLPTYASAGVLSPMLLVALRFVQGIALGGEWAGAVLIAIEHGDQKKRGRNASWTQVGPSCGNLLATGFIGFLTYVMEPSAFLSWGWRVPFVASVALVGFGLWLRKGVDETPFFRGLERSGKKARTPISEVLRFHWRRLLLAGGVRIGVDVLFGLIAVFSLTYITVILGLPRPLALTALLVGSAANAVAIPLLGALSDRLGRRVVYGTGAILAVPWTFAFFVLLDSGSPALVILAVVVSFLLHAAMHGTQAAFITEQFPTRVRYAGASLAYTLAGIVGGGFAPLIFASLLRFSRSTVPVSLYVCAALAVTLTALAVARETAHLPLEQDAGSAEDLAGKPAQASLAPSITSI